MSEEELLTELRSGAINFDDRAMELINSYTQEKQLQAWKEVRKSYPKKNTLQGRAVSKLNLADVDRKITELQAQLNKSKGE